MKHALLIAAVLAALVSTANATVNNCAVVLKTPDGFLNVRDAPGMKSTVIGRLKPGDLVSLPHEGRERNGFVFIDGKQVRKPGWASLLYLRTADCAAAQTKTAAIGSEPVTNPPVKPSATNADTPLSEEFKNSLISSSLKRCLLQRDTEGDKKTYKPEEINNYCSCFAITIIDRTTKEDYDHFLATGKWLDEAKDSREAEKYCVKYLNLPDAAAIRQRKW
jgi:hypothetical protein